MNQTYSQQCGGKCDKQPILPLNDSVSVTQNSEQVHAKTSGSVTGSMTASMDFSTALTGSGLMARRRVGRLACPLAWPR